MINIQNLSFKYDQNLNNLNNINIELQNGDRYAFIGEDTYDGKKVFFKLLTKLEKIKQGNIYFNFEDITLIDFSKDYSIGYLPKNIPFFYNKTVYQNMEYIFTIRNIFDNIDKKIIYALEKFDLLGIKDKKVKTLSNFEKIMLALCRISLRNLDLILIENVLDDLIEEDLNIVLIKIKQILDDNLESIFICDTNSKNIIDFLNLEILSYENGSILNKKQEKNNENYKKINVFNSENENYLEEKDDINSNDITKTSVDENINNSQNIDESISNETLLSNNDKNIENNILEEKK